MCVCVYTNVVDTYAFFGCFLPHFLRKLLTKHEAHQFGWTGWPVRSKSLSLRMYTAAPNFYIGWASEFGPHFCMESTLSTEPAFLPSSERFIWAPTAHPMCQLHNLTACGYGLNKKEKRERPGISHLCFLVGMHQAVPTSILFLLWRTVFSELWAKINSTTWKSKFAGSQ